MTAPPAVDVEGLAEVARLSEQVRLLEDELAAARKKNSDLKAARLLADIAALEQP